VAASIALVAAIGFTAMTGARPSTCRALLVAAFVLVGIIVDRRMRLLHALAWAASALLLWCPSLLWDPGFQLSFAATSALAIAFRDERPLRYSSQRFAARALRNLQALARASFWATLATAPISLYHFGEVSWLALLSNLLAVPLTTLLLLPLSLLGLTLSSVWSGAGSIVLELAVSLSEGLAAACYQVESLFALQVRAPLSSLEWLCWAAFVLALLGPWFSHRKRTLLLLCSIAFFSLSRHCAGPWEAARSDSLRVTFVEIGQGDAAVIEVPGGEVWLVDGGGLPFVRESSPEARQRMAETPARQALLPYLRHRRIERIDLVVVSHPHPDHYLGLQAVARQMPIDELWSAHVSAPQPGPYEDWLHELRQSGTRIHAPKLGTSRTRRGAALEVLWPRYSRPDEAPTRARPDPILSVNDNSLVLRLDFAGRRVLFTGDIEREAEELLVAEFASELESDVVKVPHHGSPTSSTQAFVSATRPALALISCGRANHFGFPDRGVVSRWREQARHLLRTDQVGSVTLEVSPEGEIEVETVEAF
jgi:competence protein ComEC